MATLKPKKKAAAPPNPYLPLTPSQIGAQAQTQATAQLQPTMDNISSQQRQEDAADATRQGQINSWGAYQTNALQNSFQNTQQALNNLVALSGSADQASQGNLAAALRAGADSRAKQYEQLGVAPPSATDEENLLAGSQAFQGTNQQRLRGDAASGISLAGVTAQRLPQAVHDTLSTAERLRHKAQTTEFNNQRTDASSQMQKLIASITGDLQDKELAKAQAKQQADEAHASRVFQQALATKEFHIKDSDLQNTIKQTDAAITSQQNQDALAGTKFLHDSRIDWANVGINRTQAEASMADIERQIREAKDTKTKERLQLRGNTIASALEALSSYMGTQKGEAAPGVEASDGSGRVADPSDPNGEKTLAVYRRKYDDALRVMLAIPGMTRSDALRQLKTSEFASWRARATRELTRLKRRGAQNTGIKVATDPSKQLTGANLPLGSAQAALDHPLKKKPKTKKK